MADNAFNPLGFGTRSHYRTNLRFALPPTLGANSRLFSIRNAGTNLLVPTRLTLRAVQTAAGTAQEAVIAAFRCTGFTAVDNTNVLTPNAVVKRAGMAAAPGTAVITCWNAAGTSGMTGGTLTKDGSSFAQLPILVGAAANPYMWQVEGCEDANGTHPFVLAANEGFEVESVLANTTSFGVTFYLDFSWAEVTSFGP